MNEPNPREFDADVGIDVSGDSEYGVVWIDLFTVKDGKKVRRIKKTALGLHEAEAVANGILGWVKYLRASEH